MAIYVFAAATGELVSWCPDDSDPVASADELTAAGLELVSGLPPLDATHAWDAASKTVIGASAPVQPATIGTAQWILRFTPSEFQALIQSTDPQTTQFMYALNHTTQIDVNSALIQRGVAYIISIDLLQASRSAAILSAPTAEGY